MHDIAFLGDVGIMTAEKKQTTTTEDDLGFLSNVFIEKKKEPEIIIEPSPRLQKEKSKMSGVKARIYELTQKK